MTTYSPARVRRRRLVAALVVAGVGLAGYHALASPVATPAALLPVPTVSTPAPSHGTAGGALPEGATPFDDFPGVAKLDDDLGAALREAASAAAADGVTLHVNSGWRSHGYQRRLLREAVTQYGSEAEAARWVATPRTSPHVAGEAVDIGPTDGWSWLSAHGAQFGLCQIYANEPWHFELRPDGCPAQYADPTQDPRMQA